MPINYPTSPDDDSTLPGSTNGTDTTAGVPHNTNHNNANTAIKALEAKLGTGASVPGADGQLLLVVAGKTVWGSYSVGGDLVGSLPNPSLVSSGAVPGTYGGSTRVPVVTVDGKGRITTISEVAVTAGGGSGIVSPLTTKGDMWVYGTADTRLPVGSNGQILSADSTTPTGLKWIPAPTSAVWGSITGSLSSQTDLQTALSAKLAAANNLSDLASASTARTNLGLGSLAIKSTVTLTTDVTGILPVANGGTGGGTFTGVVIGNGTGAFTVKTNPAGAFVGDSDTQSLTNKTISGGTNSVRSGGANTSLYDSYGNREDIEQRHNEGQFDYIASGCVLSGTAYGSTLAWALTSGVVYIGGKRLLVNAASGTVTASRDTYFDLLDPGSGSIATLVNTGGNIVLNNAASPALAANSIRLGIIISGASNIANAGSVNQGQETCVLPIASSIPYTVTDSLGNLISPRDPARKLLGLRRLTTTAATTSSTPVLAGPLQVPYIAPAGRKVKYSFNASDCTNNTAGIYINVGIFIGSITDPTNRLAGSTWKAESASTPHPYYIEWVGTPTPGANTVLTGFKAIGGGTAVIIGMIEGGDTERGPAVLKIELE